MGFLVPNPPLPPWADLERKANQTRKNRQLFALRKQRWCWPRTIMPDDVLGIIAMGSRPINSAQRLKSLAIRALRRADFWRRWKPFFVQVGGGLAVLFLFGGATWVTTKAADAAGVGGGCRAALRPDASVREVAAVRQHVQFLAAQALQNLAPDDPKREVIEANLLLLDTFLTTYTNKLAQAE